MNAVSAITGAWTIAALTLSATVVCAQTAGEPNGTSAAVADHTLQTMAATSVDDRRLEKEVHHALGNMKHLTSIGIRVHAEAGVVTLTGTVPNRVALDRAASAARRVKGVTDVRNNLTIHSDR